MLELNAAALAARLDRRSLIEALDAAFRKPCTVPMRQQYQLEPAEPGGSGGTLLVMPAWRKGGALGIKLATVFPDNALRGLPAVSASYLLLDASTGQPRAILDGAELTLRRTGAASALASRATLSAAVSRCCSVRKTISHREPHRGRVSSFTAACAILNIMSFDSFAKR